MNDCKMCGRWQAEPELQIAELEFCYVSLTRDQFFPGYTLVFSKRHQTELFHLDPAERSVLIEEVNRVAEALERVFKPAKMNYELLGNMVPHMHWHLVPRFTDDPLWPRPIWSEPHVEQALDEPARVERISLIRRALEL